MGSSSTPPIVPQAAADIACSIHLRIYQPPRRNMLVKNGK
jgi:hypothetical protein